MIDKSEIEVVEGDITCVPADAIVNAANTELAMGGGVCGAIFRAAGIDQLTAACRAIGGCQTGSAALTPAFDMTTARYIIHAVGPIYADYSKAEARDLLRSAYTSAVRLAIDNDYTTIAFPSISTGIYGYPMEAACCEAVDVCSGQAQNRHLHIKLIAFDQKTAACLRQHLSNR